MGFSDHSNSEFDLQHQSKQTATPQKRRPQKRSSLFARSASAMIDFFARLGSVTHKSITAVVAALKMRLRPASHPEKQKITPSHLLAGLLSGVLSLLSYLLLFLTFPFVKGYALCRAMRRAWKQSHGTSVSGRVSHVGLHMKSGLRRNKRQITSFLNHLLPVASIATFVLIVLHVNSTAYVVAISYRDVSFGYVRDEAVIERAQQIVQERMVYLEDSERLVLTPNYSVEPAPPAKELLGEFDLADKLIATATEDIVEGEGLYIDDVFQGAVDQNGVLETKLSSILEENKKGKSGEDVSFVNDVKIQPGLYLKENITDPEQLSEELNQTSVGEKSYETMEGDTLTLVAQKNDVSVDLLRELNADASLPKDPDDPLSESLKLLIAEEQQALSVQVVHEEVYTEEIPYETETEETDDFPMTYRKVTQSGEKGEQKVTARVTLIDGKEVDRKILFSEVTKQPVTQKVLVGTLSIQMGDQIPASVGNGTIPDFTWPLNSYTITSKFGPRWGSMHKGVDITLPGGNSFGQPYGAIADGIVTFAGYSGNYGHLVKIDHGDGVQTWYGHNSKILVRPGQSVQKGDLIAEIGSTGFSTGPHIHLEIRINGVAYNPLRFLP